MRYLKIHEAYKPHISINDEDYGYSRFKIPRFYPKSPNDTLDFLDLNESDTEILKEPGIDQTIDRFIEDVRYKATMIPALREHDNNEVQEFCLWYVLFGAEYTENEEKIIRRIAHKHIKIHYSVRKVIGIALRDELIKIRDMNRMVEIRDVA